MGQDHGMAQILDPARPMILIPSQTKTKVSVTVCRDIQAGGVASRAWLSRPET